MLIIRRRVNTELGGWCLALVLALWGGVAGAGGGSLAEQKEIERVCAQTALASI